MKMPPGVTILRRQQETYMKDFLYGVIDLITYFHNKILSLNDASEMTFTDKELHFIVIGVIGMLMILCIYPIFDRLVKKGKSMAITGIYVVTLLLVLTFAIEIGQKATSTGSMEFADIMYGMVGFFAFFAIFMCVTRGVKFIRAKLAARSEGRSEPRNNPRYFDITQ